MKTLIQKLVETKGPSGYENEIRQVIAQEISGLGDEVKTDALGNLIVRKGTTAKGGLKILMTAHMDEIGVIVTHIDDKGFARFTNIGGVSPLTCIGGRVIFMNNARGVIASERLDDPSKAPKLEQLYIDLGATSAEDCPVKVGDTGVFDRGYMELGNRLVSKAMDDRIAVAILIETLKALKQTPHELYFAFSVQEEVGLRGAVTAAFGVDPDLGIAIDVTRTGDTPKSARMAVELGKGPAVKVRDARMLADPRVIRLMVETAKKNNLPYQLEVLEGGSTDAAAIQLTRSGVPSGCISIPCRYVHHPSEMVDFDDVRHAVSLLTAIVENPISLVH